VSDAAILVTGGTGLLGDVTLAALDGAPAISLSRHGASGWEGAGPRERRSISALLPQRSGHAVNGSRESTVEHLIGDVTQPRLGLTPAVYEQLAARVNRVIHCAGVSDFTTPRRITDAINVTGTREVAAFAEHAGAALYHVSTGYVRAQGSSVNGRWGAQVYLESKRRAEQIASDCPTLAAIVRPSIVFGSSRDGSSPSFQGLHRLIGMMLENRMPLLPFPQSTRVDFLPRDLMGAVIARLVLEDFRGEYWLTAGTDAPEFDRVVEILLELGTQLGLALEPPRFVSMDMIDRLIKPVGGEAVARRMDLLLALTSHMLQEPLPCSRGPREAVDLEQVLRLGAAHWAQRHDLGSADLAELAPGSEGPPADSADGTGRSPERASHSALARAPR
jgi:nucleoside-diphosphate-sugar epimerase